MGTTGKKSINKIGKKYISLPPSGKILKKGDCIDNLFFIGYIKNKNSIREKWCDQESWWHLNIRETRRGAQRRAEANNIPFNISIEYLKEIYPKDGLCPVFGVEMSFTNKFKWRSASLDRIEPEKGYVVGNVQWISTKANTLKNNAHPYELQRLANYAVKQLREKNDS